MRFRARSLCCRRRTLAGLPVVWYGGVHCDPSETATLRRVLYDHFPTVTVIDVAATLEVIRQVMLQVIYVIQFLAAFSIFAGIVILASAIAGTRYRRIREVVVLKTLGATRPRIASIFSIEFAVLGLIAGAVGLVFANLLARSLLTRALHFGYVFQPWVEWWRVGGGGRDDGGGGMAGEPSGAGAEAAGGFARGVAGTVPGAKAPIRKDSYETRG